jgi:hypothetical protein
MGELFSIPVLIWYLKKDFREDIFRIMDLEDISWSFNEASQERMKGEEILSGSRCPNDF